MFEQYGKTLTDKQIQMLLQKGKSAKIKGFSVNGEIVDSVLTLDSEFNVVLE